MALIYFPNTIINGFCFDENIMLTRGLLNRR